MATVVVTFFLIIRFYVFKMDVDGMQSRRVSCSSQREKRWSMNSQRLEEIVAQLMKPISDVRRSFDTDLCALLEEYLTEAGLRALEANEQPGPSNEYYTPVVPNFAELALLLQHSACLYGRKVDFLYQHVINVSDSLHNSTQDTVENPEEPQVIAGSRRRRAPTTPEELEFIPIELEDCTNSRRDAEPSRPPPTLPRLYLQLEPRIPTAADAQLLDYQGEPIGLLPDFNVAWRLQNGLLVEDLCQPEIGEVESASIRATPLAELQAAFEAAAPPDPEPIPCSTPLPDPEPEDPEANQPRPLALLDLSRIIETPKKRQRKRKHNNATLEQLFGCTVKLILSKEAYIKLREVKEFSLAKEWIKRVVDNRKKRLLSMRRKIEPEETGFLGWSANEVEVAKLAILKRAEESDDDGFFEQSSLGEDNADDSAQISVQQHHISPDASVAAANKLWQEQVVQRAARQEAQVVDIQAIAGRLLLHVQKECYRKRRNEMDSCIDVTMENGHNDMENGHNGMENGYNGIENGHIEDDLVNGLENGYVSDELVNGHVPEPLVNGVTDLNSGHVQCDDSVLCSKMLSIAECETDVSRLFLASLFLANAGNIEIVQGPPLTMNSFSVRLLSTDERLYRAVAAAEEELWR